MKHLYNSKLYGISKFSNNLIYFFWLFKKNNSKLRKRLHIVCKIFNLLLVSVAFNNLKIHKVLEV